MAVIQSSFKTNNVHVETNGIQKDLSLPEKEAGFGSLINGGELFFLSIATCYCNDLYREANKKNIQIEKVEVEVSGEFGAEGEPCKHITYKVNVTGKASDKDIEDLIRQTDKVAEIHNTIRKGAQVTLVLQVLTNISL